MFPLPRRAWHHLHTGLTLKCSLLSQVASTIDLHIGDVPPHKFLPLFYQLVARMDGSDTALQTAICTAVHRCAVSAPYHTVVHLLALQHSDQVGKHAARLMQPLSRS